MFGELGESAGFIAIVSEDEKMRTRVLEHERDHVWNFDKRIRNSADDIRDARRNGLWKAELT